MRGEDEFVRVCDEHLQYLRDRCHPSKRSNAEWPTEWADTFRD